MKFQGDFYPFVFFMGWLFLVGWVVNDLKAGEGWFVIVGFAPLPIAVATASCENQRAGYTNKLAAKLTRDSLLRNLEAGLNDMRRGQSQP